MIDDVVNSETANSIEQNDILDDSPKFIKASMDQEEAALLFEQYSLVSAGVVDDQDRLIGRITADDIKQIQLFKYYRIVRKWICKANKLNEYRILNIFKKRDI